MALTGLTTSSEQRRRATDLLTGERIDELERELATVRRERDVLRKIAFRDPLTGLGNRYFLEARLADEVGRAGRDQGYAFSLLMVDLDDFKAVNDTWGHDIGDGVLRELAHFLRRQVRARDGCARLGGDEFVVVLSGADLEGRVAALSRMMEALEALNQTRRQPLCLSIGGATWSIDGRTPEALIKVADRAMYLDKRQRKRSRAGRR